MLEGDAIRDYLLLLSASIDGVMDPNEGHTERRKLWSDLMRHTANLIADDIQLAAHLAEHGFGFDLKHDVLAISHPDQFVMYIPLSPKELSPCFTF